ncbi:PepSY domain-containing protein [Paradevosia shaoguanensis]|uniref:PepSY domain-containing protein n=1 Tax=Paradevosia shaoguanensis TaxID=1335043 RepID=A0AA41QMI8_9HYPH|nr:hypothetical protein [Paradevosia shaoguanensis]MCF1742710.1 hypothetical protein [Paradevosia shaoguanensis]MCI0127193.1 hypothetical protein [Paradevosia shaoguanensis]
MRFTGLAFILIAAIATPAYAQNSGNGQGNGGNAQDNQGQGNGNSGQGNNGQGPDSNNGNTGNGQANGNGQGHGNGQGNAHGNSGKVDTAAPSPETPLSEDEVLDAVKAGRVVSLSSLVPDLEQRSGGGELIDAELRKVDGFLVYAVKVLAADGRVTTDYYYAQSGRFIGSGP